MAGRSFDRRAQSCVAAGIDSTHRKGIFPQNLFHSQFLTCASSASTHSHAQASIPLPPRCISSNHGRRVEQAPAHLLRHEGTCVRGFSSLAHPPSAPPLHRSICSTPPTETHIRAAPSPSAWRSPSVGSTSRTCALAAKASRQVHGALIICPLLGVYATSWSILPTHVFPCFSFTQTGQQGQLPLRAAPRHGDWQPDDRAVPSPAALRGDAGGAVPGRQRHAGQGQVEAPVCCRNGREKEMGV